MVIVDFLFIVTPIVGVCNCSMFYCTLLYVHSSIAIILVGKRGLVALLGLSSWCLVMVGWLFLAVPWGCLWFVIVVFGNCCGIPWSLSLAFSIDCSRRVIHVLTNFRADHSLIIVDSSRDDACYWRKYACTKNHLTAFVKPSRKPCNMITICYNIIEECWYLAPTNKHIWYTQTKEALRIFKKL